MGHPTCHCDLCQRDRVFLERLQDMPEDQQEWWYNTYMSLQQAEMDRDVAYAIIDGSWPQADDIINYRRAKAERDEEQL